MQKAKNKGVDTTAYKYFKGDGKKTLALNDIQDRAVLLMINEAVLCLEEGIIANPTDGDLGAVFGIGFLPFTGGPFRAVDAWGVQTVLDRMAELQAEYGDRFLPADRLVQMGVNGTLFY